MLAIGRPGDALLALLPCRLDSILDLATARGEEGRSSRGEPPLCLASFGPLLDCSRLPPPLLVSEVALRGDLIAEQMRSIITLNERFRFRVS